MRNFLVGFCALCVACGVWPSVSAQTTEPIPAAQEEHPPDARGKRTREFQGDDIGQVLRLLARQAKINLAVGEAVRGTVNMRLENVTAMDAIEVLVHQYKLSMTKDEKGVCYVNAPEPADAALALIAKPETADQVAAYTRNLYNALLKQGFSPGEALQLAAAAEPGRLLAALADKPVPVPAK